MGSKKRFKSTSPENPRSNARFVRDSFESQLPSNFNPQQTGQRLADDFRPAAELVRRRVVAEPLRDTPLVELLEQHGMPGPPLEEIGDDRVLPQGRRPHVTQQAIALASVESQS